MFINPLHWIRFDHYGIPSRQNEIQALLKNLDNRFKNTESNQWKGQLPFRSQHQPSVFLVGAYYLSGEDAILICADRLDTSLAVELRKLTLDMEDHLIFISGTQILCSTLSSNEKAKLEQSLFELDPQTPGVKADTVRNIKLEGKDYFGFIDAFTELDIPIPKDGSKENISCLMLKSRTELDHEIAELKHSLLLVGCGGFFMAVLLASIVSRNLARPIQNLVDFVSKFSEGTMDNRLNLNDYHGEFSELAGAFDKMQTSLLKKNRELLQADKLASLGTLSAGIAHEINNPNQYILTNTVILDKFFNGIQPILDCYQDENNAVSIDGIPYSNLRKKIPTVISGVRKGSERIKRIVGDLGEFARINPVENLSAIDLNAVVQSAEPLVENMLKKSTQFFAINLEENLPKIQGNFQRLEQVVINLLINACEALPDKSKRIEISTSYNDHDNLVTLKVRDEGQGVSKEDQSRVFDPFFTIQRDHLSIGLGLSISRTIINEHGGTIQFDSVLGKGSTMIVTLPVSKTSDNGS